MTEPVAAGPRVGGNGVPPAGDAGRGTSPVLLRPIDEDSLGERYGRLDAAEIIRTVERLSDRIGERFPKAGLRSVCRRLLVISRQASERSEAIGRPLFWLRAGTATISVALILSVVGLVAALGPRFRDVDLAELLQVLESGVNDVVFLVIAVVFLLSFEARVKRRRALQAIHELRSLAHIIDMHQLTKDPERIVWKTQMTRHSPRHDMTPFELERYLDYCGEMLALIGKIAALYVQHFEDPQAVAAVNDVEDLTSGLSRKIWQKIMILHAVCGAELAGKPAKADDQPVEVPAAP